MITQNHYKMTKMTCLRQNLHDQVKKFQKVPIFMPLPMENPYLKFILAIKLYLLDDLKKNAGPIKTNIETKIKIFTCK